MAESKKANINNPDSMISLFLGLAVVIVTGVLIVNYFRGRQTAQAPADNREEQNAPQGATGTTGAQPATPGSTYTVRPGDTLWSIAMDSYQSGYNWVDIAQANNLSSPNSIEEGQKLTIPAVAKKEPAGQIAATEVEVKKPESGTYTVAKGDSLWSISVKTYGTGYRWSEIAAKNNLKNPNVIHTGNVLNLP